MIVEKKEDGVNIRLYRHGDKRDAPYLFATRDVFDGGNPLVSAGIENVRGLGIDYGSQARKLIDKLYPQAYKLADLGYVPCFEMTLPEIETVILADRPDMILIDVIDPDFQFVDRLEKERIAEDYRLNLVELQGRLVGGGEAGDVYKRLRSLGAPGDARRHRGLRRQGPLRGLRPGLPQGQARRASATPTASSAPPTSKPSGRPCGEDFTPADLADAGVRRGGHAGLSRLARPQRPLAGAGLPGGAQKEQKVGLDSRREDSDG